MFIISSKICLFSSSNCNFPKVNAILMVMVVQFAIVHLSKMVSFVKRR